MPRRRRTPRQPAPRPAPPPPPVVGDRVHVRVIAGEQSAPQDVRGRAGTVIQANGSSVVVRMDEPFTVSGVAQHVYYSYPGELEVIRRVGRLGAVDLYADDENGGPEAA